VATALNPTYRSKAYIAILLLPAPTFKGSCFVFHNCVENIAPVLFSVE